MQYRLTALIAAALMAAAPALAQDPAPVAPETCLDTSQTVETADAYAAYCARCHEADELARAWFGPSAPADPDRTTALALFLDGHSACPQVQHELIARWLAGRLGSAR